MKVYICAAKRTPIGAMLGTLKNVHPADFASVVVKKLLEETSLDPKHVDEVISGNVLSAGRGQGFARQVAIKAGLPIEVPAYAINMVCGSGMKAIINAYVSIKSGFSKIVVAGGAENMSSAPYLIPESTRQGVKMGGFKVVDHMVFDALTDAYSGVHMGITAENINKKYGITREEQDAFAIHSQEKAIRAVDSGAFKEEIVPIVVKDRKNEIVFDTDEYPNRATSLEKLGKLRPAFDPQGSVTAGNASGINDGAAAVVVMSEEKAQELGVTPMATFVGGALGGVAPEIMGVGPIAATNKVMEKTGLTVDDMDLIEANEAFAAQSVAVAKDLKFDMDKVNVNGGAIALGHPVGASGCRILVTLLHEMQKRDAKKGLATLCIGGGMGCATIVERD